MKLGPYAIERDYSHYVSNASKIVFGIVGTASKGVVGEPTVVTSPMDLVNKFGVAKPEHLGLYAANYFLAQSSKIWFVRAASDSLAYASKIVPGSDEAGNPVDDAFTLEGITAGSAFNNYSIVISVLDDVYTFVVKNEKDISVETFSDLTFEDAKKIQSKYFIVSSSNDTATKLTAGVYVLEGGNDGAESDIDYITAGKSLQTDNVDINLFAVPGVSDPAVIQEMLMVAELRGDAMYLVDPPNEMNPDEVEAWHNGTAKDGTKHAAFNSSYGALYYSWQHIYDSVNKVYVDIPPSAVVSATMAASVKMSEIWYAPAGLTRGLVKGVIKPVVAPDTAQVNQLYDGMNAVNCIINDPQAGLCIFGQKTLLRDTTALNRVNVRMLLNYLKKVVVAACRTLTFEPNDRVTWNNFEDRIEPTLRHIKNHRGIYEYKIVKGNAIVTDLDIDNYRMPCMILIKPTKTAEEIPIYFTITSTGADFNDVLEAQGINTLN